VRTCDGFFFREKAIAVIGGGDSALDEALFPQHPVRQTVTLVHRRDRCARRIIIQGAGVPNPQRSISSGTAIWSPWKANGKVHGLRVRNVTYYTMGT